VIIWKLYKVFPGTGTSRERGTGWCFIIEAFAHLLLTSVGEFPPYDARYMLRHVSFLTRFIRFCTHRAIGKKKTRDGRISVYRVSAHGR
jgi:hypothetical protein